MSTQADNTQNNNHIAKLALAMNDYSHFFSIRRHLNINFIRDLNGSGIQGLFIKRQSDEENLIQVIFDYTYNESETFLYEADLFMDQRKDYEPTLNKGKHKFILKKAEIKIDWEDDEMNLWRSDIKRLTRPHVTLEDWLANDSEMLVRCDSFLFCRKPVIFTSNDLRRYIAMGLTLDDLKKRLKCMKCGKHIASISAF